MPRTKDVPGIHAHYFDNYLLYKLTNNYFNIKIYIYYYVKSSKALTV